MVSKAWIATAVHAIPRKLPPDPAEKSGAPLLEIKSTNWVEIMVAMIEAIVSKIVLPYDELISYLPNEKIIWIKLLPTDSKSANWMEVGPQVSLGSRVVDRYHPRESEALVARCSVLC